MKKNPKKQNKNKKQKKKERKKENKDTRGKKNKHYLNQAYISLYYSKVCYSLFLCFPGFIENKYFQREYNSIEDERLSKGTSSVAFQVLIINCQIYSINFFIFNSLKLNINLFIFNLSDVKFLFFGNHIFCIQMRTAVYKCPSLISILNSPGKMMGCYLQAINKFFKYHTLCKSILKCGFPTRDVKLIGLVLFEVPGVPQL